MVVNIEIILAVIAFLNPEKSLRRHMYFENVRCGVTPAGSDQETPEPL